MQLGRERSKEKQEHGRYKGREGRKNEKPQRTIKEQGKMMKKYNGRRT